MTKIVESIHAVLDAIITDYPGEFPNGRHFLDELETELKYYMEDGEIDAWSLHPMSSDGFKIIVTKDGQEYSIIRNADDGGKL